MICIDCTDAGKIMKLEPSDAHPAPMQEAEELHQVCKDRQEHMGNNSGCDCQHRVNKNMLNQERLPKP